MATNPALHAIDGAETTPSIVEDRDRVPVDITDRASSVMQRAREAIAVLRAIGRDELADAVAAVLDRR